MAHWPARTYSRTPPDAGQKFNGDLLLRRTPDGAAQQTQAKLVQLEADLRARDAKLTDL